MAVPLFVLYPLYAGIMWAKQASILFPAAGRVPHGAAIEVPPRARLVEVPVSFGHARAVYWPSTSAQPAPAIWYAHGNFETVADSFALVQPLVARGYAVLQFEFPGYAGADGGADFGQVTEAAGRTWDWLAAQPGVDAGRMAAMGYSIGGGAAAALTRDRAVRALVLLSTYSSIEDMAHRYLLPGFLVRFPWDNVARVRAYTGPLFIEHGRGDAVIPYARGGRRLAAARPDARFVTLDCGHDDCAFDRRLFDGVLGEWLDETLAGTRPLRGRRP